MKRIILLFIVLVLCIGIKVYSMPPAIVGGGGTTADFCTSNLTYQFYYDGDYPADDDLGCKTGGTIQGTLTSATVGSPPSGSPASGANALDCTGGVNYYITFPITTADIFDSAQGYLSFYVYPTASDNTSNVFDAYKDLNDYLRVSIKYNDTIIAHFESNNVEVEIISTDTVNLDAWNFIEVKWDASLGAGNSEISVQVNSGGWLGDSDADDLAAFDSGEPADVEWGPWTAEGHDLWMDDMEISTSYP